VSLGHPYLQQPFNTVKLIEDPHSIGVKEGRHIDVASIDRPHDLNATDTDPAHFRTDESGVYGK
jgi:hypothetical protein